MVEATVLFAGCRRGLPDGTSIEGYTAAVDIAESWTLPDLERAIETERSFDCVVTAESLDDGGIDRLRRLQERHDAVPVVYLAGSEAESVPVAAFDAGVTDCLSLATEERPVARVRRAVVEALGERSVRIGSGDDYTCRDLIDDIPDPVYMLDEEGYITMVNDALLRTGGYDHDSLVGSHITRIISMEDFERGVEHIVEVLKSPDTESATFDLEIEHADGTTGEYEDHLTAIPDGEGGLERSIGIVRDIEQRKQRERDLEQYETIVETMPEGVFVMGEDGEIVGGNQQTASLIGMDYDDLIGRTLDDLIAADVVDEDLAETGRNAVADLLSSDTDTQEASLEGTVRPVGEDAPRILEGRIALRPREDEEFRGVVGVIDDVTQREQDRRRIQVLDRVLRHNLRNELTTVIGASETVAQRLRAEHDDHETAGFADRARTAASDLVALSDKIRRIQGALERDRVDLRTIDAVEVVTGVVEDARGEFSAARIDLEAPEQAPVWAGDVLDVAVENLVENAVVHNDGNPTVSVAVESRTIDGQEWVEIGVADDGPGIPEQERVVAEDGAAVTPLQHGSGIGLWTVVWIAQSFGGWVDIEVDSTGSLVTLTLRSAA